MRYVVRKVQVTGTRSCFTLRSMVFHKQTKQKTHNCGCYRARVRENNNFLSFSRFTQNAREATTTFCVRGERNNDEGIFLKTRKQQKGTEDMLANNNKKSELRCSKNMRRNFFVVGSGW